MRKSLQGSGYLCHCCFDCFHYGEYQTSNGALPRCELDDICLSLGPKGKPLDMRCPAYLVMPTHQPLSSGK